MAKRMLFEELLAQFDPDRSRDRYREPEKIVRDFREARRRIDDNRDLTPEGKKNASVVLGKKTMEELTAWYAPLREQDERGRNATRSAIVEAVTPPRATDVGAILEGALVRQEIRRAAQGMSAPEIELLYRSPASGPEVRRALEEIPKIAKGRDGGIVVEPYVGQETRDAVLMEAGRRRAPEKATLLDRVDQNIAETAQLFYAVQNEVRAAAPQAVEREPVKVV